MFCNIPILEFPTKVICSLLLSITNQSVNDLQHHMIPTSIDKEGSKIRKRMLAMSLMEEGIVCSFPGYIVILVAHDHISTAEWESYSSEGGMAGC